MHTFVQCILLLSASASDSPTHQMLWPSDQSYRQLLLFYYEPPATEYTISYHN